MFITFIVDIHMSDANGTGGEYPQVSAMGERDLRDVKIHNNIAAAYQRFSAMIGDASADLLPQDRLVRSDLRTTGMHTFPGSTEEWTVIPGGDCPSRPYMLVLKSA